MITINLLPWLKVIHIFQLCFLLHGLTNYYLSTMLSILSHVWISNFTLSNHSYYMFISLMSFITLSILIMPHDVVEFVLGTILWIGNGGMGSANPLEV